MTGHLMPQEVQEVRHPHRTVPPWVIIVVGVVVTGAGVLWASGLRDESGQALLNKESALVLVALLGAASTLLGLILQRTGEVRHQVKNSHGTNFRDDMDSARAEIAQVRELAERAARAARKASHDSTQLREDVQAIRTDVTATASDIRGVRKDISRITGLIIKEKS